MADQIDTSTHVTPVRYLTEELPPIGGRLKLRPEDFMVEEIPLYDPVGSGEHLYLMVEKRGVTAMQMLDVLARHFRVSKRAIGYAGLKDKQAITRQVVSIHVPGKKPEDFPMLEHPKVSVLWVDMHANKLRRGHLSGNRFSIRVRDVQPTDARTALRVLTTLEQVGMPDRFGEQRFGFLANNHLIGRALFLRDYASAVELLLGPSANTPASQAEARDRYASGDYRAARDATPRHLTTERNVLEALANGDGPEHAFTAVDRNVVSYYFSAFQSAVFNAVLDERLDAGTLGELLPGDVAMRIQGRKMFNVDEVVLADPETPERLRTIEISASGPMWGTEMRRASGATDELEVRALERFGMTPEDFARLKESHLDGEMTRGTRRPLRVPVRNIEVEGGVDEHGSYVRCAFDLPRGAFATAVMAEVMKPDRVAGNEPIRQEATDA